MKNEISVMIKIRCGKRTPLEVTGYHYGNDDNIQIGKDVFSKGEIVDWIVKITEIGLNKQIKQ